MHDFVEFLMLDKEAVVSKVGFHHFKPRAGNVAGQLPEAFGREEYVGAYPYHESAGLYSFEGFSDSSSPSPHIVGVGTLADSHIGVDIEAAAQFLSLVFLIGLHAMEKGVGFVVAVALAHVVGKWASIAYQGDGAGCGKSLFGCVEARLPPCGVGVDGHIHRLVERGEPWAAGGVGGAEHHVFGNFRVFYHPFYSLESSKRHSDYFVYFFDAEVSGQEPVGFHHVAYGDFRKVVTPRFAGGGADRRGAGGAIAGSKHIGANYKIFFRVEEFLRAYCAGPPVGHVGVGCQPVHDPDNVAFVGVKGAECVVCNCNAG